jgi:hypothetical protein
MAHKLKLSIIDIYNNNHNLFYLLEENSIATAWYKKIKHLYRVPLSDHYTFKTRQMPLVGLNHMISQDLMKLNELIKLNYPVKESYDRYDCNTLHDVTVSTQYDYSIDVREIFHRMHRNIHSLEYSIQETTTFHSIYAGWGEKEGLLTSNFDRLPYDLYRPCDPGTINLCWGEFGKTPWHYWKDQDLNNVEHFLKTCKPHMTFRAQFNLSILESPTQFDSNFEQWFDSYRSVWQQQHGCDWTPLYQWGGIPLARPENQIDWSTVDTILSIQPIIS